MSGATLHTRALNAFYGATQVLFDIHLTIPPQRITVLLGDNGAGKTALLRALMQEIDTQGSLMLNDQPLHGRPTEAIARLGLMYVPEDRGGFPALSVRDNLRLGGWRRGKRTHDAQDWDTVMAHFAWLGSRMAQQAGTLSGGEQCMLAIARALLSRPKILLLDEPSLGLAPAALSQVYGSLRALHAALGLTMLVVEQDSPAARALADQIYTLEQGRLQPPVAQSSVP